ncbi:GNAT family N-acetyltransferase [Paenibacillus anaericanus]|uniref:GNAT family N-acetyltransferase n=2 Tax=Paenibacillus TaxID=44249 RepID=A0A3S1DUA3_9BACL|nr:GNAT family N-acetyltransferase [Paenibacillus anaericanus]
MMIREAEIHDAAVIEELYRVLLPNNQEIAVWPERIQQVRESADSFLLVYEEDGCILGTLHLHICLDALSGDRPFGVIERVVVSSEQRGKGIGNQMMKFAEELAKERSCVKLMLTSGSARVDAHRFYSALGFDGESSKAFKKYL